MIAPTDCVWVTTPCVTCLRSMRSARKRKERLNVRGLVLLRKGLPSSGERISTFFGGKCVSFVINNAFSGTSRDPMVPRRLVPTHCPISCTHRQCATNVVLGFPDWCAMASLDPFWVPGWSTWMFSSGWASTTQLRSETVADGEPATIHFNITLTTGWNTRRLLFFT